MNELRDPDRPGPPDRPESPVGRDERVRLSDLYQDDDADIFPADAGSPDRDTAGSDRSGDVDDGSDGAAGPRDGRGGTDGPDGDHGDHGDGSDDGPDALDRELSELEDEHPEVGAVVRRLTADTAHTLDLTEAIRDPRHRADTLATVRELAEGRLLPDNDLQRYREENPGQGRLFDEVATQVNQDADGTSRKDSYLTRCAEADPARRVGGLPDAREREAVDEYAQRLADRVEPVVIAEAEDLAAALPGSVVSARSKLAEDILEKVQRMSSGSDTRPPRDDYHVGDVVDAVGARITAADTDQLGRLLDHVCGTLGVGDGGRVLELDNMYARPKASNPSYRVIPLLVSTEVDGVPYAYELQLATRRASVAADLEHNTIYKDRVEVSDAERAAVRRMMNEAAALDQRETRSPGPDQTDDPTRRTP